MFVVEAQLQCPCGTDLKTMMEATMFPKGADREYRNRSRAEKRAEGARRSVLLECPGCGTRWDCSFHSEEFAS